MKTREAIRDAGISWELPRARSNYKRAIAGPPGFEPGLTDPESAVLPLHHGPVVEPAEMLLTPTGYDTLLDPRPIEIHQGLSHSAPTCRIWV